ncbi:hypothetical protein EGY12_03450 [Serratia sp. FDAARGOS_506]|nr:hypothetical protein EGY12_03450 [Serratia sp. FDAARGOS_506]
MPACWAENEKGSPQGAFNSQTKEEKTWFFLLGGHQPKINKLIFLIFYILPTASQATPSGLS